jgi:adenylyl-sulfate kinase
MVVLILVLRLVLGNNKIERRDEDEPRLLPNPFIQSAESPHSCWTKLARNRFTETMAAGESSHKSENITWTRGKITPDERARQNQHSGCVVWLTGLSAAGKSTIATELERELFAQGKHAFVLDGDNMRHGLCSDLGFSPEERKENIRRIGEVAKLFAEAGFICITAFISPYRSDRDLARKIATEGKFIEVYLNVPMEICEQRDPKGLYAKARSGQIKNFTGVSAPYEPPLKAELELRTDKLSLQECVAAIQNRLMQLPR